MKKILKYIGIGFVILFIVFLIDTSGNDESVSPEDSNSTDEIVINFPDFINQKDSYFLEKLGEPDGGVYYEDSKTSDTEWSWDKDNYLLTVNFIKGEPIEYISAKFEGECDQKSDKYLKKVGLSYPIKEPNIARDGHLYRWEPYNEAYERLNIYCEGDTTNIILLSKIASDS